MTLNWGAHPSCCRFQHNSSTVSGCGSGGDVCSATYGYRRNNLREQSRAGGWWRLLLQTSLPSWPLFENYSPTAKPGNFPCSQPVGFELRRYPATTTLRTRAWPPKRARKKRETHIVLQSNPIFIHLLSFSRLLCCLPAPPAPP